MKLFKILTSLSLLTAFTYANESLLNLHKNLIEKPSITKTETEAVDYLYNHLQSLGWKVELQTVNNPSVDQSVRRQNIFAYLGDNRDDVSLILNSHLDVVPPYVPYRKEVTNNNKEIIYGRGSNDAKGQIAAQVTAIETLRQQSFDKINNVGVLYDVGEEGIFDGMSTAQSILPPSLKYVVVGEPTELKQISGHKGNMGFEIRAKGLAAHSSNPQWGINAIEKLSEAVLKLKDIKLPKDDLLGDTTIAVTKISGGTAINKVPDEAVAYVNVRTSVPCQQTWEIIKNSDLVNEYIDLVLVDDPHDPVKLDVIENWRESTPMPFGTDLFAWKHPAKKLLIGCGSVSSAHKLDEHIYKQELLDGVDVYVELISGLLNGNLKIEGDSNNNGDKTHHDEL